MMRLIWMSLLVALSLQATAQITSTFPKENPILQQIAENNTKEIATQRSNPQILDLPFFDDFSYNGPFPVASHWMDKHVFINNTWANDPVSIGIATFDGLDASGSPYSNQLRFGSSDTLTSVPLNLGGLPAAYISYYVQPKGLGDTPEPNSDLILEFLTATGEWKEVQRHTQTLRVIPRDSILQFAFVEPLTISGEYLYDGFQFRFRNFSLRNGAVDLWHLDYVRVEDKEMTKVIDDLAFTKLPQHLFNTYTSVPWTHFINPGSGLPSEELRSDRQFEMFNHATQTISANNGLLRLLNVTEGKEERIFPPQNLFTNPAITTQRQFLDHNIPFPYADRIENLQSSAVIQENNRALIKTQYQMNPSPQAAIPEITRNDTVCIVTEMSDYYAYDDGSAESAILISELGGSGAMEFFNYKTDSIRGFQIQIPRLVAGAASGTITLKVWVDNLFSEPIAELPISPFFLDEFRDTLQAFTTYTLKDPISGEPAPVELPRGVFFVGWEQRGCRSNCVPVGLDKSRPEIANRVYLNEDGNWRQVEASGLYPNLKGALMLRPIVGDKTPIDSELATSTKELLVDKVLQVFPNPAKEVAHIQLFKGDYANYHISIHDALGKLMEQGSLSPTLNLANYQTGMYFLQFRNIETNEIGYYKLVKN